MTKKTLARRTFLRGTGVAVALPLLDAMVPALTATARTAAKPVPRLGYFYVPNGMSMPNWRPKNDGSDFEFSPILQPLEKHRDYITAVSGLSNYQSTLGSGGGVHTRAMAAWMTGVLAKPTEGSDVTLATTADQYAARVLGTETVLDSLELGLERRVAMTGNCEYNYSCLYESTLSWRSPSVPNPIEINPRVVFERLFGEESDPAARLKRLRRNKSILDEVTKQVAGLRGTVGGSDRAMVDEYLEAIRDTERRIQKVEKQNAASPTTQMSQPMGVPDTYHEHGEIMLDLLFLAYQADITRVATFMIAREGGGPGGYPWIGVPEDHHETSHHQNNPDKLAKLAKINTYHVTLFERLVDRMKKTTDGDGTLLDHAYLLYGAGISDGDLHSPLDVPLILAGHGCGALKGNRHISYPLEKKMPMTNLHITMLHKLGVPIEKMSDSTGELTELLGLSCGRPVARCRTPASLWPVNSFNIRPQNGCITISRVLCRRARHRGDRAGPRAAAGGRFVHRRADGAGHFGGCFYVPHDLAVDSKGNINVADVQEGKRVQRFLCKGLGPARMQ